MNLEDLTLFVEVDIPKAYCIQPVALQDSSPGYDAFIQEEVIAWLSERVMGELHVGYDRRRNAFYCLVPDEFAMIFKLTFPP